MRLIHECMGIPVSPPATSEDGEVDSDSPPLRPTPVIQPITQQEQPIFNPQLIRIDELTMQLHFTPLYFGNKKIIYLNFIFKFFSFRTFRNNRKYEK
jgi:hypothetical protein